MGKVSTAFKKAQQEKHVFSESIERKTADKMQRPPSKPQAKSGTKAPSPTADPGGNIIASHWDERLSITTDQKSPITETFNRLRSKILHPAPKTTPPRTILLTSASPGEGKGFVCANLGIALARGMSHHALLVDCDLRRPSLAGLFGQFNDRGLSDYLQNNAELPNLIRKTGMPKLSFIAGGSPPINPAELLDSQKMSVLITELASRYSDRFILFDTPPSVVASETKVLSKYVDGVIIVVRWGKSDRQEIKRLVDTIGRDKIIGIVFNAYETTRIGKFLTNKKTYGNYYGYYK